MAKFNIAGRDVGENCPTYFIADIAANHDGSLSRAVKLIELAAKHGANAVKFQHFRAEKIVSNVGFLALGRQFSHQSNWKKSVVEVYRDAELPREWSQTLKEVADALGVHFFSSTYDLEAVRELDDLGVPAFKLGSGDISWVGIIDAMAATGKPMFAATGASEISDVIRLMNAVRSHGTPICLMQCNTNYTGSLENIKYVNLNVLRSYAAMFPDAVLGLSDHTPGHVTVLGAVALGARAVEKHFTDDTLRVGPDHAFSMDGSAWGEMVQRTRELEASLGSPVKVVAENEKDTYILQRRSLRSTRDLPIGHTLRVEDIEILRPAPPDGFQPWEIDLLLGKKLLRARSSGDHFRRDDVFTE